LNKDSTDLNEESYDDAKRELTRIQIERAGKRRLCLTDERCYRYQRKFQVEKLQQQQQQQVVLLLNAIGGGL
jgi:hypothetical protein